MHAITLTMPVIDFWLGIIAITVSTTLTVFYANKIFTDPAGLMAMMGYEGAGKDSIFPMLSQMLRVVAGLKLVVHATALYYWYSGSMMLCVSFLFLFECLPVIFLSYRAFFEDAANGGLNTAKAKETAQKNLFTKVGPVALLLGVSAGLLWSDFYTVPNYVIDSTHGIPEDNAANHASYAMMLLKHFKSH